MTHAPLGFCAFNRDGQPLSPAEIHRLELQKAREERERHEALRVMRELHALSALGEAHPKPMLQQAREMKAGG